MGNDPSTSPPSSRRRLLAVLTGILVFGSAAAAVWCSSRPKPAPPPDVPPSIGETDPEDPVPAAVNPGYLGPQACAPCHASRVAEFLKTNHAHACRTPDPASMPPGFAPGRGVVATHEPGVRFEMGRSGDAFFQTAVVSTPAGEKRDAARIALVYGGGRLDEVNFAWAGDRLYELPTAWLYPLDEWGVSATFRYSDAGAFAREATTGCLACHTTWFSHVAGTTNEYRPDSFLIGVTCERCHGPGRDHVAFHKAHPKAEAHAVVHPGKLSRERQLDVCLQCHSNAVRNRGPEFGYRPGQPLDSAYRPIAPKYPEEDHVANQIAYLRQSKCFQKSEMTCTTCHDPHKPHAPDATGVAAGGCASCHKPADCREQPRLPEAVRGDCTGCHMPPRVWMNVNFNTAADQFVPPIRRYDHRIAVHPESRDEVLRNYFATRTDDASRKEAARLSDSLSKHWLAEADRRRKDYRFLAAIGAVREALRVDPSPAVREKLRQAVGLQVKLWGDNSEAARKLEERKFPEAIALFEKVLSVKPDWAAVHGKLGTAYAAAGQRDEAVKHLTAVAENDPDDAYGLTMLGWLAYLDGDHAAAAESYRRAEELEPFTAKICYYRGLSLLQLNRVEDAAASFRRALVIDPRHAGACQGLSHVLRRQGKKQEALDYARKAARLTKYEHADVLLSLTDAFADAGRPAEAAAAAEKGLTLARAAANAGLVSQFRTRLADPDARAGK